MGERAGGQGVQCPSPPLSLRDEGNGDPSTPPARSPAPRAHAPVCVGVSGASVGVGGAGVSCLQPGAGDDRGAEGLCGSPRRVQAHPPHLLAGRVVGRGQWQPLAMLPAKTPLWVTLTCWLSPAHQAWAPLAGSVPVQSGNKSSWKSWVDYGRGDSMRWVSPKPHSPCPTASWHCLRQGTPWYAPGHRSPSSPHELRPKPVGVRHPRRWAASCTPERSQPPKQHPSPSITPCSTPPPAPITHVSAPSVPDLATRILLPAPRHPNFNCFKQTAFRVWHPAPITQQHPAFRIHSPAPNILHAAPGFPNPAPSKPILHYPPSAPRFQPPAPALRPPLPTFSTQHPGFTSSPALPRLGTRVPPHTGALCHPVLSRCHP